MGGRLSITGYNSTLLQLTEDFCYMADMYQRAARSLKGDKQELLLRLAEEETISAQALKYIYTALFCIPPQITQSSHEELSIGELIRLETTNALHLAHMSKTAPRKYLSELYSAMVQQAIHHGYLLLLL